MYIIHVFINVKPDYREDLILATLVNAKASVQESGIARFDILQDLEDLNRFVLVEVYRTKDDHARHQKTAHYQRWKDDVADMMAAPRTKKIYENLFPADEGWG